MPAPRLGLSQSAAPTLKAGRSCVHANTQAVVRISSSKGPQFDTLSSAVPGHASTSCQSLSHVPVRQHSMQSACQDSWWQALEPLTHVKQPQSCSSLAELLDTVLSALQSQQERHPDAGALATVHKAAAAVAAGGLDDALRSLRQLYQFHLTTHNLRAAGRNPKPKPTAEQQSTSQPAGPASGVMGSGATTSNDSTSASTALFSASADQPACTHSSGQGTKQQHRDTVFAVPASKRLCRDPQQSSGSPQSSPPSPLAASSRGTSSTTSGSRSDASAELCPRELWFGTLSLATEDGSSVSELCHVTLQLPAGCHTSLRSTFHLHHLVQRGGVMIGPYQVVKTQLQRATQRQLTRLCSMAQRELVAVGSLNSTQHLVLVPYLDTTGTLKLVCFLLNSAAPPA